MKEFTKEEAEQYSKNLKKIYKPTGRNIFNMNEEKYTYDVKYPLGTYLYVVELYRNPDDSSDSYFKITFEGELIGILISKDQVHDGNIYNHYTIQKGCQTVCVSPEEPETTYLFTDEKEAKTFCDNPTFYGVEIPS